MKRVLILFSLVLIAINVTLANDCDEANALVLRLSPKLAQKVTFELITATSKGNDVFSLESRNGKVVIGGNNANSMAVGLNRYLNRFCKISRSQSDPQ